MTEPTFPLTGKDAEVVYSALRHYAEDVREALSEDDESPLSDDVPAAEEIAQRLQRWLVANRQTLIRDT